VVCLCIAIGVVSYVLVPFIRDIAVAAEWMGVAAALESGPVRLSISLGVLWASVAANLRGITFYERLVVPLMFLTFAWAPS
jgi:basic amino acid/polyamine antiporter, APA family